MTRAAAPFQHLLRLTDEVGLLEHAQGTAPRLEHGYCVDDVARGLVVVCREPSPARELSVLARRYLDFLAQAQAPDGRLRNRLGYDRRWHDEPGTEDCWGRAVWGFGTAAARGLDAGIRAESRTRFERSAQARSPWPHAMAFAALGAAEILEVWPDHSGALGLLAAAAAVIGEPSANAAWPWPLPRLTYANAALAEAVIVAGSRLGDDPMLPNGMRMLEWLLECETRDGHLSVVPVGGWSPGEERPGFDQQPIEVAAMADACVRAASVTGDPAWLSGVEMCVGWFLGDNDAKVPCSTSGAAEGVTASAQAAAIATRARNQRWR